MFSSRRARWLAYLLAFIFCLGAVGMQFKILFLNWDDSTQRFEIQNALFDDGGTYVSELHVQKDPERFEKELWFTEIRDKVTSDELFDAWGPHGPRVQFIFTGRYMGPYFKMILAADRVIDDLALTFTLSLMFFSAILVLKYVLLLLFCRKEKHSLFIAMNLAHDLFFIPGIQGSEHVAVQLMLLGLSFWLFAPSRRPYQVFSWTFMGLACLLNPIPIGPTILLAFTHLRVAKNLWLRIRPRFLWFALAGLAGVVLIQGLQFLYAVQSRGAEHHFNTGLTLFVRNLSFLGLGSVVLLMFLHYVPISWPEMTTDKSEKLRLWVLLIIAAAVVIALVGPLIHFELWENNARYQRYILIAEVAALVTLLPGLASRWGHHLGRGLLILAGVVFVGSFMNRIHPGQPFGWSLKIHRVQHFDAQEHYPQTLLDAENKTYYEAGSPQQVYGYFIRKDYTRGPLILAIDSDRYDPARVLPVAQPNSIEPIDNPDPTP
jgi:hypothetical protein